MRSRFFATATAAAGLLLAAGCGSSGATTTPSSSPLASSAAASTSPAANPVAAGCPTATPRVRRPQQFSVPKLTIAKTAYTMRITIECKGTIVIAMNAKLTPYTVNSFAFLAAHNWFNNTPCQRLTTAGIFILQCGDPTGTGRGGPGYTIPDENLKGATYPAGTVAMANEAAPHTGGSQFFLVYGPSELSATYTPFGKIIQGLSIVKAIAAAGENDTPNGGPDDGTPVNPVVITKLTVTKN